MPRSGIDTRDEEGKKTRVCGTKRLRAKCRGPEREVRVLQKQCLEIGACELQ